MVINQEEESEKVGVKNIVFDTIKETGKKVQINCLIKHEYCIHRNRIHRGKTRYTSLGS